MKLRVMLVSLLCAGSLSGCYVEPVPYGTPSAGYGGSNAYQGEYRDNTSDYDRKAQEEERREYWRQRRREREYWERQTAPAGPPIPPPPPGPPPPPPPDLVR
jgi:hypothetical protein